MNKPSYVGRFAPSPTGPLHFGSLVAALAGYLDARAAGGLWLLRIEDLDPPREDPNAPAQIIEQMKAFGLDFDGEILYQSTRLPAYQEALEELMRGHSVYPCTCSRKSFDSVYPGRCRNRKFTDVEQAYAIRFRMDDPEITFDDRVRERVSFDIETEIGDFVVKRKDSLFAYQLAVVVDDAYQGITDIIRGNDLIDSTPRQLALIRALSYSVPRYAHFPVITGADGQKLSKQSHAPEVDSSDPLPVLRKALRALGQPTHSGVTNKDALIDRAVASWNIARIPQAEGIPYTSL